MSMFSRWLRPQQESKKEAAQKSDEVLEEKVQETRDAASRLVKQSRQEIKKSEEVILVAEHALRTIKGVAPP